MTNQAEADPREWLAAFGRQSANPEWASLYPTSRAYYGHLPLGMSGASLAHFVWGHASLVLKWGRYDEILAEAQGRVQRISSIGTSAEAQTLGNLRRMGASHVALRVLGNPGDSEFEAYGVIAYEWAGPKSSEEANQIGTLEWLISDKHWSGGTGRDNLQGTFKAIIHKYLAPFPASQLHYRVSGPSNLAAEIVEAIRLPEKFDQVDSQMQEQLAVSGGKADDVLASEHTSVHMLSETLVRAQALVRDVAAGEQTGDFSDRRCIHGDLRLSNLIVDALDSRYSTLVDFGRARWGHVLEDIVTVEADLLLRCGRKDGEPLADRARALFSLSTSDSGQGVAGGPLGNDPIVIWREARDSAMPRLSETSFRRVYSLFMLAELLRRLQLLWKLEHGTAVMGCTPEEVAEVLRALLDETP